LVKQGFKQVFTKKFIKDLAERALSTFAQTLIAGLAVSSGLLEVKWVPVLSVAGLAAFLSVLKSLAAAGVNDDDSASLVNLNKS
jgi:hypothetical protein